MFGTVPPITPTVAPHAGAWIETPLNVVVFVIPLSPLTQGRGLKPKIDGSIKYTFCRPSRRGVD